MPIIDETKDTIRNLVSVIPIAVIIGIAVAIISTVFDLSVDIADKLHFL